jgi:hypothetical protein
MVRNSFGDEKSSAMAQEDEPDERERVEVERERVVLEREREAAGFLAPAARVDAGFFAAVERAADCFFAAVERDAAGFLAAGFLAAGFFAAVERDDAADDEPRPGTSRAATRRASVSTSLRRPFKSSAMLRWASSSRIRPTALATSSTISRPRSCGVSFFFLSFFAMARV